MQKITLLSVLFIGLVFTSYGQKFGYVDTEYVLNQMPEYKEAQSRIQELARSWQDEIKEMIAEKETMYEALEAEKVLLTEEMIKERKSEIKKKEEEIQNYQQKVFGYEGLFYLKKEEIVKPVMDQVFEAVSKVAKDKKLQIVFDKSGDLVMIYTNPVHDYTDYVLEELGLGDKNDTVE
ncbi:OmpH family outer membrane protein [Marinigracilibium pacificum]|uniref:OmpH family outer membrane protein n=1 Tax=Marinigracilibium pacificum TaxID=2729599 RepID=A0A848J247_9BACT|nr:OmpH family outer membrane protein [Marinigracilibium pacificum]NMM49791.1 OmpH family outer membrane protein [Marinigracilibium pacificum]